MDEKNVYIAVSHMKSNINWEGNLTNEWSFVDKGEGFKEKEVQRFLDSYFTENELYFVIDRHNGYTLPKSEAAKAVKKSLANQNITLCNSVFSKMVEFSYIGVVRYGAIKGE